MTFLRVATCPLRCLYCDTPDSYEAPARRACELAHTQQEPNPVGASRAAEARAAGRGGLHAGRQDASRQRDRRRAARLPQFVKEFGQAARAHGLRLHLETAAHDPGALEACVHQVDHLSADYKLPETLAQPVDKSLLLGPGDDHGARHVRCCELALRRGATVDVKIVLTDGVSDVSFERALEQAHGLPARSCSSSSRSRRSARASGRCRRASWLASSPRRRARSLT